MGRRVVQILAVGAVFWGVWWWAATTLTQRVVMGVVAETAPQAIQMSIGSMTRAGFPLHITTHMQGVNVTDTTRSLRIPQASLSAPVYWPGHATLHWPEGSVILETPQGQITLQSGETAATLRLYPGIPLPLEAVRGRSTNITLDLVEGRIAGIETLDLDVRHQPTTPTYEIELNAGGFAPGRIIRQALRLPVVWPEAFESVTAQLRITFDRPWDRHALGQRKPQPQVIEIEQAQAVWAGMGLSLRADLTVDDVGTPSGTLRVRAENWQKMLDLASNSGALTAQSHQQAQNMLTLLAGGSGDSTDIDLEITVDQGQMRMGFIPLGTAPRLVIR